MKQSKPEMVARLEYECARLAVTYRTEVNYGFDPEKGWWVQLKEWSLPKNMQDKTTELVVLIPAEYPLSAPERFLTPENLISGHGWAIPNLFPEDTDHQQETGVKRRWSRFQPTTWRPGDDLDRWLGALGLVLSTLAGMRAPKENGLAPKSCE